jgi:hypothetical protein
MFRSIAKLWSSLFVMFSVIERTANSLDNLASVAEDETEGFKQQMTIEREARHAGLLKQLRAA